MIQVPKLSQPLSKLIRTGEGVILFAFNTAMIVLPALNDVPWGKAVPWLAITNAVAFASRTFLKAVALTQGAVGGPPIEFKPGGLSVDEILKEIEASEQAAAAIQAKPGLPASEVTAGLAPEKPAAKATEKKA